MPALGKILAFGSFECTLNFRFLGILRWIDERNECLEEEQGEEDVEGHLQQNGE